MRNALKTLRRYASLKTPFRKTQWETGVEKRARMPSGSTHTPTLLMVVFGLASTVKGVFGDDDSFGVVTKTAFILNTSPFASVLPSGPPCISLFALVLSDAVE
jgi:hypothetical protein